VDQEFGDQTACGRESETTIVRAASRFTSVFSRWMTANACEGMNFVRLEILQILHEEGDVKMGDLAQRVSISARNMTAIIDAMEQAGLVVRVPHPEDRRATFVHASPEGSAFVCRMMERGIAGLSQGFTCLSSDEHEALAGLLTRVADEIDRRLGKAVRELP
jgi:DNA-binding MarR family transcriptional regulator